MNALLEIAAFNIESALIAAAAGADRIELCSGQLAGGLTPTPEMIMAAKAQISCPFFVMIRAKGGDFAYSDAELAQMKADLLAAKALGADGFVFGILTTEGIIDEVVNTELVQLAHPLPCTFHRAFDDLDDKTTGLDTLIRCGFKRVLTSGGAGNAIDFCTSLTALVQQADGRIIVMPGGGIRVNNIGEIKNKTGAVEYHSAAIINGGTMADAGVVQQLLGLIR